MKNLSLHKFLGGLLIAAAPLFTHTVAQAAPGDLDTTFGGTGKVTADLGGNRDEALGMALQTDGKIVVAGRSQTTTGGNDFGVARYNTNGTLDATFGVSGKVAIDFAGRSDSCSSVAVQADGKIVLVGTVSPGLSPVPGVARLNANGTLDTSFGGTGKMLLTTIPSAVLNGVVVQRDGKVVAVGSAAGVGGQSEFLVLRFNTDGAMDTTFGGTGVVHTNIASSGDSAYGVALQADGKIVAAGSSIAAGAYSVAVVRYNTDGSLDLGFGGTGKATAASDIDGIGLSVALQSDGKVVVGGYALGAGPSVRTLLVRFSNTGTLDTSFGSNGRVVADLGGHDSIQSVKVQTDGKIVAAGTSNKTTGSDFAIVRYTAGGALDTTFGTAGEVITDFGGADDAVGAAEIQQDGKIVVAGYSYTRTGDIELARYNGDAIAPVLPDLQVRTLSVSNNPDGSRSAIITATIANADKGNAAPSTTLFKDGSNMIGIVPTKFLGARVNTVVTRLWNLNGVSNGNHVLTVIADSENVVAESTETNNTLQATVNIQNGLISLGR